MYLVCGKLGLSSSADETHVVRLTHHLDQANARVEVCESVS
jgi:hypothetical protein